MNRGCHRWLILALCGGAGATPAFSERPTPSLSIDPIVARSLLAPVDDSRVAGGAYRLDPGRGAASGKRARLSVDVGDSTLFAITGRLAPAPRATGPLDPSHARALGQRRADSKVYGAGVSRTYRGVDVSATYQYSKLRDEVDTEARGGPGRSHSLRATARIRFKP